MKKALIFALLVFGFATTNAYAASLNVRIETPGNMITRSDFNIKFVALDIENRAVTARCFKKGPSDALFTQFGGDIALGAGGDSDVCNVPASLIAQDGTYQFFVRVLAGADLVNSSIVSLDVNTDGPGTPTNYSKTHGPGCQYRISFKTADDGGETVKVELYRSDSTSFGINESTRVDSVAVGSNTSKEIANPIPDCGRVYYYAVRAFNSDGVPSGVIGDANITFITTGGTTTTTTVVSAETGAIPVGAGAVGVGGLAGEETLAGDEGAVAGEEGTGTEGEGEETAGTPDEEVITGDDGEVLGIQTGNRNALLIGGGLLALIITILLIRYAIQRRK